MSADVQIAQDARGWFFSQETGAWRVRKTGEPLLDTNEGPKGKLVPVVVGGKVQPGFDGFVGKVALMLARQAYPHAF